MVYPLELQHVNGIAAVIDMLLLLSLKPHDLASTSWKQKKGGHLVGALRILP